MLDLISKNVMSMFCHLIMRDCREVLLAMSMGRPILTTDAAGCKETVNENINGFLVPIGSSKELAKRMIWFINNRDKLKAWENKVEKL